MTDTFPVRSMRVLPSPESRREIQRFGRFRIGATHPSGGKPVRLRREPPIGLAAYGRSEMNLTWGQRSGPGGLHLMWSKLNDPIDKLDFVYVYRIQPRLCTSQMPLIHRNDFSCSTLNSMLPSMSEPSI